MRSVYRKIIAELRHSRATIFQLKRERGTLERDLEFANQRIEQLQNTLGNPHVDQLWDKGPKTFRYAIDVNLNSVSPMKVNEYLIDVCNRLYFQAKKAYYERS